MPLVFVHGVSNRQGPKYDAGVKARDALFRRFLLGSHRRSDGAEVPIVNPYWGDLGGRLRWNGASLPAGDDVEALGSQNETLVELYASALADDDFESSDQAILQVARRSLSDAVDLLWVASVVSIDPDDDTDPKGLAALGDSAYSYALANPTPPDWLHEMNDDEDLISRLSEEVESYASGTSADNGEAEADDWEPLGLGDAARAAWGAISNGARTLRIAVTGRVGRTVSERVRPAIAPGVVGFLGDVLAYLHQQQDAAGSIRDLVARAINDAQSLVEQGDELVIVAHSMGGNIVYDLLTSDLSETKVPLLITAGTQIGFFEELKLFTKSDDAIPSGSSPKVKKPPKVERWLNIFDYSDLLGFRVEPIIEGAEDFSYGTGSLLNAHGQYFLQPGFHERLAKRVLGTP